MLNGLSIPFKKILMLSADLGFFFKRGGLNFCVNSLNFHLCFPYSRLRPENENIWKSENSTLFVNEQNRPKLIVQRD